MTLDGLKAMLDELKALYANNTWTLVPRESSMNVIGCKWIFKTKLNADGTLDRLKASLVAKGFHQIAGINYHETFSPVIHPSTIRTVITIALIKHWDIRQLDVKNAFLHGDLNEPVYMEQPLGFIHSSHIGLDVHSPDGQQQAVVYFLVVTVFLGQQKIAYCLSLKH
ncbi:uncharacterized mitochondrial protein AtMg00820-like [Juglans regia]|uniref:Uncharacterized mitochondrial protein AtMg00820-like n=1 Tax=Juglans regia TaxID=51240 RepID=A0A6P9EMM5_JUGRE|nr:uncharacterized mitochondrial protein AtMg00820-like [Juglans regia]